MVAEPNRTPRVSDPQGGGGGSCPFWLAPFCVGRGLSGELFVEETGMFEVDLVGTAHHFPS